jgi:hypothetical protein
MEKPHAQQDRKSAPRNGGGSPWEVDPWHPEVGGQGVPQGWQGRESLFQQGPARKAEAPRQEVVRAKPRMRYLTLFNGIVASLLIWVVIIGLIAWLW